MQINFRWNPKNRFSIAALGSRHRGTSSGERAGRRDHAVQLRVTAGAGDLPGGRRSGIGLDLHRGGPHPSGCPEESLEHFDYVVIGEGEATLPELIGTLQEGGDVSKVKGIAYMRDGSIIIPAAGTMSTLTCTLLSSRLSTGQLKYPGGPVELRILSDSRLFGHRMRHRSIESIAKYDKYYDDKRLVSPNAFAYGSDGIRPNPGAVENLLKNFSGNIYFGTFPSEVRPEFVTPEMVSLVATYCANTELHLGGQSGSDRVLRAIHRGHTAEQVVTAACIIKDAGLTPVVDFIFGLPGEHKEDQAATLECIRAIIAEGGKIRAHYFLPLPGTELAGTQPAPSRS